MRRAEWLQQVYRVPNPFDTLEQALQARHDDVPAMPAERLRTELAAVRLRLMLSQDGDDGVLWLLDRQQAIRAALR